MTKIFALTLTSKLDALYDSMQHTDKVGILPGEQMKFGKDKERNNHRKLYRERQYPILRLGESQRGVREPLTVAIKIGLPTRSRPFLLAQEEGFEPPWLLA